MKRSNVFILHLVYWLLFQSIYAFFLFLQNSENVEYWDDDMLLINFSAAVSFYVFYSLLFDRYLKTRKFRNFFIAAFITCVLTSILVNIFVVIIFYSAVGFIPEFAVIWKLLAGFFIIALVNGIAATCLKGIIYWYRELRITDLLKRKNLEAELAMIKAQLSPHFLFNTINNIDVLIGIQPAKASTYLQKLSAMLRQMLYKSDATFIPVSEEIQFIQDYIELQKIRKPNSDWVQIEIEGDPKQFRIAPLMFLPFVENAFKHVGSDTGKPFVKVLFRFTDAVINFVCENSISKKADSADPNRGLGLSLVKQRLDLLYFEHYSLQVEAKENIFRTQCEIFDEANKVYNN